MLFVWYGFSLSFERKIKRILPMWWTAVNHLEHPWALDDMGHTFTHAHWQANLVCVVITFDYFSYCELNIFSKILFIHKSKLKIKPLQKQCLQWMKQLYHLIGYGHISSLSWLDLGRLKSTTKMIQLGILSLSSVNDQNITRKHRF